MKSDHEKKIIQQKVEELDSLQKKITQENPVYFYSLRAFIEKYQLSKEEQFFLVSQLAYGIYYGEIDINSWKLIDQIHNFKHLFLQTLVPIMDKERLKQITALQSEQELLLLIAFLYSYYREGSFKLLSFLEEYYSQQAIGRLIRGCTNGFFLPKIYIQLCRQQLVSNTSDIIIHLEQETEKQIGLIHSFLHELVPLMVDSPLVITKEMLKIAKMEQTEEVKSAMEQQAVVKKEELLEYFSIFYKLKPTAKDIKRFAEIFGLTGHYPPLKVAGKEIEELALLNKLIILRQLFSQPLYMMQLSQPELHAAFAFVKQILLHIEALCQLPLHYQVGLYRTVCAIATTKNLEDLTTLPSLIKGLESLFTVLGERKFRTPLSSMYKFQEYPILVFDQSPPATFQNNAAYIEELQTRCNCRIQHISQEQALLIAQKIGILPLIQTNGGMLGYGGARNCQFLLSTLIRRASWGNRTIGQIAALPEIELRGFFWQTVLTKQSEDKAAPQVVLLDDDHYLPESNIFGHMLFASLLGGQYASTYGYFMGRATQGMRQYVPLYELLENPSVIYLHTSWSNTPALALLSECLTHPRITLNLPFPSEEGYFHIQPKSNPLLKPNYHLAGTRYPKHQIPVHPLTGIEETLAPYLSHTLMTAMVRSLLNFQPDRQRSIFPWNEPEALETFSSLKNLLEYVADDTITLSMQQRFWQNINHLLFGENMLFSNHLLDLISCDSQEEINAYITSRPDLDKAALHSIQEIAKIYDQLQKEANQLTEYGLAVAEEIQQALPDSQDPWYVRVPFLGSEKLLTIIEGKKTMHNIAPENSLSHGFYLLLKNIGCAQFNEAVKTLLSQYAGL